MSEYSRYKIETIEIDLSNIDDGITEYSIVDFADNEFDTDIWKIVDNGISSAWQPNNNRLEGTFGYDIVASNIVNENYALQNFFLKTKPDVNFSFDIQGKIWKANTTGNRSIFLGIYYNYNYFAGIAVDNVYSDGNVSLIIGNNGGRGNFEYLFNTGLSPTTETEYRVTYNRITNEINFYYNNAGSWTQLGTTQIISGFDLIEWNCGVAGGLFNTTAGGTVYADDIYLVLTEENLPETTTHRYISTNLPIQILNDYYGYKPYLKQISDIPAEIKEKDTLNRRLKVTLIDDLVYTTPPNMASYWRMWIAANKNYKGKIIRYYSIVGGQIFLRFVGTVDNITIDNNGTITIEAVDLLKQLSKIKYPFLSGIKIAEDLPGVFPATSDDEMKNLTDAIPGDYCKRTEYISIPFTTYFTGDILGSLLYGRRYFFQFIAYDLADRPLWSTGINFIIIDTPFSLGRRFHFDPDAAVSKIEMYGSGIGRDSSYSTDDMLYLIHTATPGSTFDFQIDSDTYPDGTIPDALPRYYKLKDNGLYSNLVDWEVLSTGGLYDEPEFTIDIEGDISLLDDSGYLKVDDEIFYYSSIGTDSEGISLVGLLRGFAETESPRHIAGTALYYIISVSSPINIFNQMKKILALATIDDAYISTQFDTYAALDELDVTTLPIIEKSTLAFIYFDLVNLADCISFQNEEGLIDILKLTEDPIEELLLTDEANIIYNSTGLDLNEDSRFTRWLLLWNRLDLDKKLDDDKAYYRGNLTVDGDAEEFYEDSIMDKQYTTWLNPGTDSEVTLMNDYINDLLNNRRIRTRESQWLLKLDVEIKDEGIKLGQIIFIKTQKVLAADGTIQIYTYRVVKRDPSANKITLTCRRIIYDDTTES